MTLTADHAAPEREFHIRTLGARVRAYGIRQEIRDMLRVGFALGREYPSFVQTGLRSHIAVDEHTPISACGRSIRARITPAPLPWIIPIVCRRCIVIWADEHRKFADEPSAAARG